MTKRSQIHNFHTAIAASCAQQVSLKRASSGDIWCCYWWRSLELLIETDWVCMQHNTQLIFWETVWWCQGSPLRSFTLITLTTTNIEGCQEFFYFVCCDLVWKCLLIKSGNGRKSKLAIWKLYFIFLVLLEGIRCIYIVLIIWRKFMSMA